MKPSLGKSDIPSRAIKNSTRPTGLVSFFRAQIAAFTATAVDFIIVIFLTELASLWYVISNICGTLCGAITSFLLGRNWAFVAKDKNMLWQAVKYAMVATGSMGLNTLGVYLITEYGSINYIISKLLISAVVGIGFNYTLHRWFVFK